MLSLLTALCALRLPDAPASAPRHGFPSGNVLGRTASTCPPTISTVRAVLVPEPPPESQGSLRCWNWDFNPTDIPPRSDLLSRSGRVSQPYSVTYDPCDESVTLDHIFHDKMMQPAWPPWPGVNPHVNPHRNARRPRGFSYFLKMLLDQYEEIIDNRQQARIVWSAIAVVEHSGHVFTLAPTLLVKSVVELALPFIPDRKSVV